MTGPDGDPSVPDTDLELAAIVAVAKNGVIGRNGEMPWYLPEDLQYFKRTTMDHPIVMGRVTYEGILEAIGEPLPGRTTIVLTSQDLEMPENAIVADGLEDAIGVAERAARERHDGTNRLFIAGGATVYEQFLPALDRLFITEVHDDPDGDTRFPDWDRSAFEEVARDERDGFAFVEYTQKHE
jgi:dihydrofolate reductase